VLKYISLFRIFEQLAVALETEFSLKIFKQPPFLTPRPVRLWTKRSMTIFWLNRIITIAQAF